VMFATGRAPYTQSLGLEEAGVKLKEDGSIIIDDQFRTSAPNIFAIGDVTNRINLTPVAIREAVAFAQTQFNDNPTGYDYDNVPTAVFSQPPIGTVGLTEAEARKAHGKVDIYLTRFRPMKQAFFGGQERTLMKLIVEAEGQRVVGCHVVGEDGPEMIQLAAIAVKMGVTKQQWDNTTALHPTAAEELVTLRERYVSPDLGVA
jgi:glutathione reductase (NADPH)